MRILHKVHGHAKNHYHRHYKTRYQERAHLVFLLDVVLVSIALFMLGLGLFFRWFYHPLRDDFKMSLLTEQTITAGKETTFTVRIINGGVTDLHGAKLAVHLPDAFVPAEMPPRFDAEEGRIAIGDMPAHISNEYRFRGTLLGPAREADVYVHFTATNDAGTSDEKLTKGVLHWQENTIVTRIEAPDAVVPGQTATFAIRVKNGSAFSFETATIVPTWPKDFRLQNATPPVYRGAIALGRLDAGEEIVVKFSGRFTGISDLLHFSAALNGVLNGHAFALSEATTDVRMASVDVNVEAVFPDGATSFVRPGQEVAVTVRYRNEGKQTVKNMTLAIAPDANTLGAVRWETSARIDALAAGEAGERKAFVRVKDAVSRYVVNPMFRAVPQATFSIDDPKITDAQIAGTAVETKIAGTAKLRAVARYYTSDGDQLGRGPLPPRVGKTTRYWIFASLETGGAETSGGVATFRLPGGVAWTGRSTVTAGQDLSLEGDRLVWHIGTTSAHAGLLSEAPSASFEVSLTPDSAHVGTAPFLLAEASYMGEDAWTGEALTSSQAGLTTQLPGDPAVAGRTVVKP